MSRTLDSVDPVKSPTVNPSYPNAPEWAPNTLRQSAVVDAWCGAAYDEATDTMWLGMGGGHGDYAGNEIYKCGFFGDRPGWQMVRRPSGAVGGLLTTNDGQEPSGVYADGRPRAVHTYNKWVYVPNVGPVLTALGPGSWVPTRGGKRWGVFINEGNGEAAFTAEPTAFSVLHCDGAAACYDSLRKAIWIVPGNTEPFVRYDLPSIGGAHTGRYTAVGPAYSRNGYASACYLPDHDCILIGSSDFGETTGVWLVFDCATGTYYVPTFSGAGAIGPRQGNSQPRWVQSLGAACTWNNSSNTTAITKLMPGTNPRVDTWTVSTLSVAGANNVVPSAKSAQGTYGRFAYSSRLGGFLVFNSTMGPTYFFKL